MRIAGTRDSLSRFRLSLCPPCLCVGCSFFCKEIEAMCGIVGLLVKNPALKQQLGAMMVPMLVEMGARGPDSAGLAVFTDQLASAQRKYSLYAPSWDYDWAALRNAFVARFGEAAELAVKGNHAVFCCEQAESTVRPWIKEHFPALHVLSAGRSIYIYKDVGHPAEVAKRYQFQDLAGTHLVGHTRMATESAVTPAHAHPFTAGEDFCLVHNGALSNPYSIRRKLEPLGITFDTDNDTEAATRFLEWRMREGD